MFLLISFCGIVHFISLAGRRPATLQGLAGDEWASGRFLNTLRLQRGDRRSDRGDREIYKMDGGEAEGNTDGE